ncbi:DUF6226 family protein [Cryobacterium sp. Hh7]|uniref:DUF6226 family protein n=1 Tax=Cryobacterium sp. Hh7 TaxID=1259159 RepID=UPI00351A1C76
MAVVGGRATALVEWLEATFIVDVEQNLDVATDLLRVPDDVAKAVRVVPRKPTAASLTFVLTPFRGIFLHAGLLHDFHFPVCGCDACDDDVTDLMDDLEWTVRTVVSGGYSERLDLWPGQWVENKLNEPGVRMSSGRSRIGEISPARVKFTRKGLPPAGIWSPWPLRPQGTDVADSASEHAPAGH